MGLFDTVLEMSLSASLSIAAVLLLRLMLGRMPKGFTWVLWLAVLVRLWIPAFPVVSLSAQVPAVEPTAVLEQVFPERRTTEAVVPSEREQSEPQVSAASPRIKLVPVLWGVGACSVAIWGLLSDLCLRKRLRTAVRRKDGVWLADGIESPFVHGLFRPRIYLPSDWDGAGERYILLHERRHICNLDPVVKLLFFGALCIHWFNPLVWLTCYLVERDMELRCDEGVFRSLDREEQMEYAAALVACAAGRRTLMPLAFGEGDTKRRVKNMLTYRKPKWWAVVLAGILCITAAGCMLVDMEPSYDPAKMEYPGLRWGMSPEEVQGALGFSDADIVEVSEDHNEDVANAPYWERDVGVQGVTAFGQKTTLVVLGFRDYTQGGGSFGLVEVRLFYPDGYDGTQMADIQALSAELERHYGPAGEKRYWDRETDTTFDPTQEQPANTFEWNSALTGWSCLSEEEQEAGRRMFDNTENTIGTWEEFVEELNEISVYSITLQPICNYTIEVRLGHPLTEEQRRNGVTDLCITMDARNYFSRKHYAEIWLEAE